MEMNVKLLDCTLRDGGYVNDWEFGNSIIRYITARLIKSGIDFIEVGFLDDRREPDINRTIFPNTEVADKIFDGIKNEKTRFVAMIDYGTCSLDNISNKSETLIDGIRIVLKKKNMHKAIEYAGKIMEKGYFVMLQMVSITTYKDRDILDFCDEVNRLNPYAVAIVDTYGLMHEEQVHYYFEMLDHNLNPEIAIGYHSHNNFQLAYANTIEVLGIKTNRTIILDGTEYGMGKSAGNAPIELLAMHLNEFNGMSYDINQILEVIDTAILPIYNKSKWGYELLYYLAASNNCHPSYINYLMQKSTLSVESVNKIVKKIEPDKKLNYDKEYIGELYKEYQNSVFEDADIVKELKDRCSGRNVLIIAPGNSINNAKEKINKFIQDNSPIVVAVNFIPRDISITGLFIGNSKRYGILSDDIARLDKKIKTIATSNVSSLNNEIDYIINMNRVKDDRDKIADNSTAMLLNLIREVGITDITLAGVDGYDRDGEDYCDDSFGLSSDYKRLDAVNEQMKQKLKEMSEYMNISFITKSKYQEVL